MSFSFLYDYDPTLVQLVGGYASLILPNTFATLLIVEQFQTNALISLTETVTKTGSDDVTYQMKVDGILLYWNGSAWAASDGSYAQSNAASVVNTNAASLITSPPRSLQVQVCLKGSGATSPQLNNLAIAYDISPIYSSTSGQCVVYCYLRDIAGDDLTVVDNAPKLIAVNDTPFLNQNYIVPSFYKEAAFAADSFGLIANLTLTETESTNQKIRFMIQYEPNGLTDRRKTIHLKSCVIPNQSQIDLTTITDIDTNQLI